MFFCCQWSVGKCMKVAQCSFAWPSIWYIIRAKFYSVLSIKCLGTAPIFAWEKSHLYPCIPLHMVLREIPISEHLCSDRTLQVHPIIRIQWKLLSGLNRQSEIWKYKQSIRMIFFIENYSIIQSYAKNLFADIVSISGSYLILNTIYTLGAHYNGGTFQVRVY